MTTRFSTLGGALRNRSAPPSVRSMRRALILEVKKELLAATKHQVKAAREDTLTLATSCKSRLLSFDPLTIKALHRAIGAEGFVSYQMILRADLTDKEIRMRAVILSFIHRSNVKAHSFMAVAVTLQESMGDESWEAFLNLDESAHEKAHVLFRITGPFIARSGKVVNLKPKTVGFALEHPELIDDLLIHAEERGINDLYSLDVDLYLTSRATASPALRTGAL